MLQKHQRFTVDYMLKHPQQHGILVAHQMGTGKTLLAIAMADAFQGHDVVVIAPGHLQGTWQREFARYSLTNSNIGRFSFHTYNVNDLKSLPDLRNAFVVLDEAHHIVEATHNATGPAVVTRLQQAWKVLLLTGTPLYTDETDIVPLLNIASGKNVLSTNPAEFSRRHTRIKPLQSAFIGYWIPGISMLRTVVGNVTTAAVTTSMLPFLYMIIFREKSTAVEKLTKTLLSPVRAFGGVFLDTLKPWIVGKFYSEPVERAFVVQTLDEAFTKEQQSTILGMGMVGGASVVLSVLTALNWMVSRLFRLDDVALRVIDPKTFRALVHQYVSFYKINTKTSDFASTKSQNRHVPYTQAQMAFFLRFCDGLLNPMELTRVVSGLQLEQALLSGRSIQAKLHDDIQNGLRIGNLYFPADGWPAKFEGILQESRGQPSLIYSNFIEHGIQLFAQFLTAKQQKFVELGVTDTPTTMTAKIDRFNSGQVQYALLHPTMTEGLSFLGVRQVHFLEPVVQQAIRDQVEARAVRYRSHAHLPVHHRHVVIYTWVADMGLASFGQFLEKLKHWVDFKKEVMPGTERMKYNYAALKPDAQKMRLLTPDVIQLGRITSFGENVRLLLDEMATHSIESTYKGKVGLRTT